MTGHTANDRAETVLLNLARGCHRQGLASLSAQRPLREAGGPPARSPLLVRPLLVFSRDDTGRICRDLGLPVQLDASNLEPRFARNRVRAEVMPVLEALHPGAARRIAALAQRLEQEQGQEQELLALALQSLTPPADTQGNTEVGRCLSRPGVGRLAPGNRCQLLAFWLRLQGVPPLSGSELEQLAAALAPERGPGERPLAGNWLLRWDRSTLVLHSSGSAPRPHG